jgi:glycosyltransferase involved in cell wall biosynthesis
MKPLISVVIPHKNSSNTLESLLETIPNIPEIEIIVVDDKSDWEELNCLQTLSEQRSNLLTLVNEGAESNAGAARNIGLDHITGEWVLFADSDDEFLENAFDKFFAATLEYDDFDVVLYQCCSLDESRKPSSRADKVNSLIEDYPGNIDTILYEWLVPWGKLIKLKLINDNGLRFDSCVAGNDVMFSTRLAAQAKNVLAINAPVYCCFSRSESLTSSLDEIKALSRLSALVARNVYLSRKKVSLRRDIGFTYFKKSKPFKITQEKIRIYSFWIWQLILKS